MRKRTVAALVVAVSLLILPAPDADAVPGLCEHRGMDHIQRHGGKLADDAWHRDHHEQVTCDADGKDHRGDDHPEEPRHDEIQRHDAGDDHHDDQHRVPGHDNHKWWRND